MQKGILFTFIMSCLLLTGLQAQSVDLQFADSQNGCANGQYCVDIEVRSLDGADLLGSSSIRFSYDPNVIYFEGSSSLGTTNGAYTSVNFDDDAASINAECTSSGGGTGITPYAEHAFDGMIAGEFLLTFVLLDPTIFAASACPSIANDWETVAEVCFDVLDANGDPNIQFSGTENGFPTDFTGTVFSNDMDDPVNKYNNGTFTGTNTSFTTLCTNTCPVSLYVPGPVASNTYSASNDVYSDGNVNSGANVTYQAENYVELQPNFDVPINTDFSAIIAPCVP